MSTTPPSSEEEREDFSSAEELDKTIVSAEPSTSPERPLMTTPMHSDGTLQPNSSQQPTFEMQPQARVLCTARPPPFDPKQIREPLGPNGLPSPAVAQASTSYESHRQVRWPATEHHRNDVLPHHRSPRFAGAPPPTNQCERDMQRLDGLPPPASTSQPSCSQHARAQLQSSPPQQHGPPSPHGHPTATTTHHSSSSAEYLASIRELREQILSLQREQRQIREMNSILRLSNETYQRVISGGSFGSGNISRLSSEFAGFGQSTCRGQPFLASTASDPETHVGAVTHQQQDHLTAATTTHAPPHTSITAAAAEQPTRELLCSQPMFSGFGEPASSHTANTAADARECNGQATDRRSNVGAIAAQFPALAISTQHGGTIPTAPAPQLQEVVSAPPPIADACVSQMTYAMSSNAAVAHASHIQAVVSSHQQAFQPSQAAYTQPVQHATRHRRRWPPPKRTCKRRAHTLL